MKSIGLTAERKHIKGHQDKEQEIQCLAWPAQLNCVCDHIATQQLADTPLYTKVIKNPFCNAYVSISGESVTGQIRKALFDAAGRPRLRTYLLDHFHWSEDVFEEVHWNALLSAVCGLSAPEHLFVVKLSFKLLPVGFRLQQRQAHMPPQCPSCEAPMEDDWHWILCESRDAWRQEQAQLFSALLVSLKTNPSLTFIAKRAYASLLSSGDCSFEDAELSVDETSLISSQASIGWDNMLFGRFSVEWSRLQDVHIAEEKLDGRFFSGPAWTSKVTQHIWRALHSLWKIRNTDLHGVTFTENETTRRTRIEPIVRQLYSRIYDLAPSDRAMFRKPLDERLQQPLSIIETWLSIVQPALDTALRDHDDFDDRSRRSDDTEEMLRELDAPPG